MGGASSRQPLASTDESTSSIQLYDKQSILQMKREVAQGYIILLSGGLHRYKPSKRRSKREKNKGSSSSTAAEVDESALQLAFMAIVDGNVVDSCFGVPSGQRNVDSVAYKNCRKAKNEIADASDTSSAVRGLAVKSYEQAMQVVMDYRDEMDQLNLCSRCIWSGEIYHDAETSLKEAFEPLDEALAAAN